MHISYVAHIQPAYILDISRTFPESVYPLSLVSRLSSNTLTIVEEEEEGKEDGCVAVKSSGGAWLIKLKRETPQKTVLLNPLSRIKINPIPKTFPPVLNSSDFRIFELGKEYAVHYPDQRLPTVLICELEDLFINKAVLLSSSNLDLIHYAVAVRYGFGKLGFFRADDESWTVLGHEPSPFDDVVCYDGKFYAVDNTGKALAVEILSLNVTKLIDTGFNTGNSIYENQEQNYDHVTIEETKQLKVFKLDHSGRKWVEVKTLGDRILFIGANCSFSASASDFSGCKGNCIFFTDREQGDGRFSANDIGVFDLENGSIGPLASYPGYSQLFWPLPTLIKPS
uniref:KIB1-4 beta-propeller domain-containing protein n=1 Tax=Nelumbo nucifera TaxID=4432 RepID=A0A822Z5S8_NELNU|nr:TPA_asm: hypothetical protein HUJ06_016067 [Nelumbo nucifera]